MYVLKYVNAKDLIINNPTIGDDQLCSEYFMMIWSKLQKDKFKDVRRGKNINN